MIASSVASAGPSTNLGFSRSRCSRSTGTLVVVSGSIRLPPIPRRRFVSVPSFAHSGAQNSTASLGRRPIASSAPRHASPDGSGGNLPGSERSYQRRATGGRPRWGDGPRLRATSGPRSVVPDWGADGARRTAGPAVAALEVERGRERLTNGRARRGAAGQVMVAGATGRSPAPSPLRRSAPGLNQSAELPPARPGPGRRRLVRVASAPRGEVWLRIAEEAVARIPAETPAARGRRLVDALIVWITPDRQSPASTASRSRATRGSNGCSVVRRMDGPRSAPPRPSSPRSAASPMKRSPVITASRRSRSRAPAAAPARLVAGGEDGRRGPPPGTNGERRRW